jgi:hypothetical protein
VKIPTFRGQFAFWYFRNALAAKLVNVHHEIRHFTIPRETGVMVTAEVWSAVGRFALEMFNV